MPDEPSEQSDAARIDELEHAAEIDHKTIDDLERQGIADRDLIAHLEEQGILDQAAIARLKEQARIDHEVIEALVQENVLLRSEVANLEIALKTARRIGGAIGVLMASLKVTETQAFELMKTQSQRRHVKLREIAEEVLLIGAFAGSAQ